LGRNTPSLRVIIDSYIERLRRVSKMLPPEERAFLELLIEDIESTLSVYTHIGVVDPIEIIIVHIIRRLNFLYCKQQDMRS